MTKSQIEKDIERGTIVLKQGGSFADIQAALTADIEKPAQAVPALPEAPAQVVLTDDVKKALRRLPDVFAVVQPAERRALDATEIQAVHEEREVLKQIVTLLAGRDDNLKEIIRNHMDVVAEKDGRADESTERDDSGHYILASKGNPERCDIPGTNQAWSREYRSGRTTTDDSVLDDLMTEGKISRDAYLAMTREVRVFDANKAMLSVTQKPDLRGEIFSAIKAMTKFGRAGTSLFVRKSK